MILGPKITVTRFGELFKGKKINKKKQISKFPNAKIEQIYFIKINTKDFAERLYNFEPLLNAMKILEHIQHPHIQKPFDMICCSNSIYVITDFLIHNNLNSYLRNKGIQYLNESEALSFLRKMVKAIKELHNNNIIHKNICFESIFIDDKNHLCIGGFYFAEQNASLSFKAAGSQSYMAYEMLKSNPIQPNSFDSKVDLWSIGVVYYRMLTGNFPFNGFSKSDLIESIQTNRNL